jgi:hypothetical protein
MEGDVPAVMEGPAPAVMDGVVPAVMERVAPAVMEGDVPAVMEGMAPDVTEGIAHDVMDAVNAHEMSRNSSVAKGVNVHDTGTNTSSMELISRAVGTVPTLMVDAAVNTEWHSDVEIMRLFSDSKPSLTLDHQRNFWSPIYPIEEVWATNSMVSFEASDTSFTAQIGDMSENCDSALQFEIDQHVAEQIPPIRPPRKAKEAVRAD